MGVSYSTFRVWRDKYSALSAALKKGKEVVDFMVESAMLKSALGHIQKIKKPIKLKTEKQVEGKGKVVEERIEYAEEEIYIPPQVVAQIYWLKNRKSSNWKDKPEGENFNEALQDMLKGITRMNSIVTQPAPNRNIEDLE